VIISGSQSPHQEPIEVSSHSPKLSLFDLVLEEDVYLPYRVDRASIFAAHSLNSSPRSRLSCILAYARVNRSGSFRNGTLIVIFSSLDVEEEVVVGVDLLCRRRTRRSIRICGGVVWQFQIRMRLGVAVVPVEAILLVDGCWL
jgi:hypothetical protein